jgi:class 3 adenylate cyclase
MGDLRQIAHHQRQVMALVHLADLADTVQRLLVAEMAAQGVAGIGRQGDDGAVADEFGSLHEQARLGDSG